MASHLQAAPDTQDGVFWNVFEHLASAQIKDRRAMEEFTSGQRAMFAIGMLRQEVGSGGFDCYFRYSGGNTALDAANATSIISPAWVALFAEAMAPFGAEYPVDIDAREDAIDAVLEADEDVFEPLDLRLYDLEADDPADDKLDAYIWSHQDEFFEA